MPTAANLGGMRPLVRGPLNPSRLEMRLHARQQIEEFTGETLQRVSGQPSQQCFRFGNKGPLLHLHVNKPALRRDSSRRVYFFGEAAEVWDDSDAFLVLQCGLDFTLLVPIADWLPYKDQMGVSRGGARINQHIHLFKELVEATDGVSWFEERVELCERDGFRLSLDGWGGGSGRLDWVNNFFPLIDRADGVES